MKKICLILPFLLLICLASAQTTVHYFYGIGCPHCANVEESGILEQVESSNISVIKYEIYHDQANAAIFYNFCDKLGISKYDRGIPFVVIQCNGNFSYLLGDGRIIDNLLQSVKTCEGISGGNGLSPTQPSKYQLTIWSIVIGALIDSINPCAFAVLIFLLVTLRSIGSKKRMLKAALLYIAAVYITYFLAGIGIFRAIQSLTRVTRLVYFASGVIVIIAGLLEIKDYFWYGKGLTLQISPKFKPIIESVASKGTLPAVILLGFLVSLFELPCTGGIYLAILTMMSISKSFAFSYLLLYNFIFILPLIVISLIIYKGTSPQTIEKWRLKERKWMKLAAGLVLVALGLYILLF
jgi:cytochrome c biogenesis protein CcdA